MSDFIEGPGLAVEVRRDEDGCIRIAIPQLTIEIEGDSSEDALGGIPLALSHTGEHVASYLRYLFDEEGVLDQDIEMWFDQGPDDAFGLLAHIVPADVDDAEGVGDAGEDD